MDRTLARDLNPAQRLLLLLPIAGGLVFGLGPLLIPETVAALTGYRGDDPYIGRLAGAAALGYAVALALGVRAVRWEELRAVVVATLAFNLVSLGATLFEIVVGRATPIVYVIAVASAIIIGITWSLLGRHGATPRGPRDAATWVVVLLVLATAAATVFGLGPLFPQAFADIAGYHGNDKVLYRLAGAATFGYAVMGVWELRSLRWAEMRLPNVMAVTFNGAAFLASLIELSARVTLLVAIVAPASLVFTLGIGLALARRGR